MGGERRKERQSIKQQSLTLPEALACVILSECEFSARRFAKLKIAHGVILQKPLLRLEALGKDNKYNSTLVFHRSLP